MKMTAEQVLDHQRKHGFIEAEKVLTLPLLIETLDRIDFFMEFEPPKTTSQMKGEQIIIPKGWPADKSKRPFVHHFKKKDVEEAEKDIARRLLPFKPRQPFTGPMRLVTEWTWEWRVSEPKKNRVDGWAWHISKPDFDNISKTLVDQMAALGFLENDSQICDARVTKQWGDRPGIRITLEALTPQLPIPAKPAPVPMIPKPPADDQSPF